MRLNRFNAHIVRAFCQQATAMASMLVLSALYFFRLLDVLVKHICGTFGRMPWHNKHLCHFVTSVTKKRELVSWLLIVALGLFAFVCVSPASAQVPKYISFQGRLTDADDNPLSGEYDITFRIYNAASAGEEQWQETQTLSVSKGIFSCLLGSVASLEGLDFDESYWFSVEIGEDGEMEPRQRITAVAYAINSDKLDSLDATQFLRSDVDTTAQGTITFSGVATDITTAANEDLVIDPTGTGNVVVNINSASDGFKVVSDSLTTYFLVDDEGNVTARNIAPQEDDTYDLGSEQKRWKNIYVETINADAITGSAALSHSLDAAYDDGSTINVDEDDLTINLAGNSDFVIQDEGTAVFTVEDSGDVTMSGSLDVTGDISTAGNFDVNIDRFAVDGETGDTEIAGTLEVADRTEITYSGTETALIVTQGATGASAEFLGGYVQVGQGGTNNNATGAGDMYVTGDLEVDGTIYADIDSDSLSYSLDEAYEDGGTITVDSHDVILNLTASNDFLVQDNGDTSFAVTDAGVTATKDIMPLADSQYTIGSDANRFSHIYADSITVDTINAAITADHSLDDAYDDGSAVSVDDTDVEWDLIGGTSFIVKDDGTAALTVDENGDVLVANDLTVSGTLTAGTFSGSFAGTLPASQVTAGTFDAGDFAFQDDLTVDTNTLVVDSTNNRVGVGTTAPATALDVVGTITGDGLTIDGTVSGSGFTGWDRDSSDDLTTATDFGGEVSGTYDAIVIDNDALDDQYIELADTFAGEVGGTYDAMVIDNDALDDQYVELGDSFGGDVSGTYSDLQLVADAVGADELSSTAIQAGDIEAADLPADGYASTYVNADGDTMTGTLSIASTTPADLVIDNTTVGTPDAGNLASDSGSIYLRGNYFDDSDDSDTTLDMSMKLDIADESNYKLSVYDDAQINELFSIDQDGNVTVAGTLSATNLSGSIATSGTSNDTFTVDTDLDGGETEPADGAGFIIEGGTGDVSILWDATEDELDINSAVSIGGDLTVGGDIIGNIIGDANTVDFIHASAVPTANYLVALNASANLPADTVATASIENDAVTADKLDITAITATGQIGAINGTNFSSLDGSALTSLEAANVDVADAGENYTAATVEDILAEISDSHIEATDNPHAVTAAQTGAIEDTADVIKESHLDFGIGADQIAISDFPEGANTYVDISGDTMTGALVLPSNGLTVGTNQLVTDGGNVGIGLTNPSTPLEVAGRITAENITLSTGASEGYLLQSDADGNAVWASPSLMNIGDANTLDTLDSTQFLRSDTSDTFASGTLTIDSGATLDVNGQLVISDADITMDAASTNLTTTGDFSINTNDIFVDKTTGRVGIGVTNPNTALDVEGTVRTNSQFVSTVATGTAPMSVVSQTVVSNLNADLLDGQSGAYYLDDTTLSEAEVEAFIFDADNTGTLSSGTLALSSLSYTGLLSETYIDSSIARDSEVTYETLDAAGDVGLSAGQLMPGNTDNWINTTGDTMTGDLTIQSASPADLIIYNNKAGADGMGDLASDSGYITLRGNHFNDTTNNTTVIDMSMNLDITDASNYKLSILDDDKNQEIFSIDQDGNVVVQGTLTADTLIGPAVTSGTENNTFTVDTDLSVSATEPADGTGFIMEGGTGDVSLLWNAAEDRVDLNSALHVDGALEVTGILTATTLVGNITGNADTVDNLHASATPTANYLVALDENAYLPADTVATASIEDSAVTADKLDVVAIDSTTGKVTAINATNFTSLDGSALTSLEAANVDVADAGSNYTATTTEGILAEISDSHIEVTTDPHGAVMAVSTKLVTPEVETAGNLTLDATSVVATGDIEVGGDNIDSTGALILNATTTEEVRIGAGTDIDLSTGAGDLYVTNNFEVDGSILMPDDSLSPDFIDWADAQMTLTPEYPNASLYGDGTNNCGTMVVENGGAPLWKNYYEWSAKQRPMQDYMILIRQRLPQDFKAFADDNAIVVDYQTQTGNSDDSKVDVKIYKGGSSSAAASQLNKVSTSWADVVVDDSELTSETWAAGDQLIIEIKVYSTSKNYIRVSDITINYKK